MQLFIFLAPSCILMDSLNINKCYNVNVKSYVTM
jgi:hypothetical protein